MNNIIHNVYDSLSKGNIILDAERAYTHKLLEPDSTDSMNLCVQEQVQLCPF